MHPPQYRLDERATYLSGSKWECNWIVQWHIWKQITLCWTQSWIVPVPLASQKNPWMLSNAWSKKCPNSTPHAVATVNVAVKRSLLQAVLWLASAAITKLDWIWTEKKDLQRIPGRRQAVCLWLAQSMCWWKIWSPQWADLLKSY